MPEETIKLLEYLDQTPVTCQETARWTRIYYSQKSVCNMDDQTNVLIQKTGVPILQDSMIFGW